MAFEQRPEVGRREVEVWWREEHFRQREQPVQRPWGRSLHALEEHAWGQWARGRIGGDEAREIMRAEWPPGDSCKVIGFLSEWRRASLENFDWRNSGIWFLSFFFPFLFFFKYFLLLLLFNAYLYIHLAALSFSCHTWYLCCGSGLLSNFDTPTVERMDSVAVKRGLSCPVACGS